MNARSIGRVRQLCEELVRQHVTRRTCAALKQEPVDVTSFQADHWACSLNRNITTAQLRARDGLLVGSGQGGPWR